MIPLGFRVRDGAVGHCQRLAQRPLLPIRDRLVVLAFGHAPPQAGAVEGGRGDLPGPDRLRVPPPQVADDPQIVGAAAGGDGIAVPAGGQEGLREVVRRLVDPSTHQRDGAPRIEGVTLDRLLVPLAGQVEGQIEPPLTLIVPSEPRVRSSVQQGETRRIRQFARRLCAEVFDDLGMASDGGELPGRVRYD